VTDNMLKHNITFLFVTALCLLPGLSARADNKLDSILVQSVKSYFQLDPILHDVEISRNRISLENRQYDSIKIIPLTDPESWKHATPRGLISLKVEIYKDNSLLIDGQARFRIRHFSDVLISTGRIGRNKILNSNNFQIKRMEVTSLTDTPLSSERDLSGRWTRRSIGTGQILTNRMFEQIPTVRAGQEVSILYKTSTLQIKTAGTALQPGITGDIVRVRNNQSNKIITCAILDKSTVQVTTH
jgi:flagella basal body P-ring formation protein FlgA